MGQKKVSIDGLFYCIQELFLGKKMCPRDVSSLHRDGIYCGSKKKGIVVVFTAHTHTPTERDCDIMVTARARTAGQGTAAY